MAMDGEGLKRALAAIGWTNRHLGSVLGCDHGQVSRWGANQRPIPRSVAVWLQALVRAHEKLPPPAPEVWRQRAVRDADAA